MKSVLLRERAAYRLDLLVTILLKDAPQGKEDES